MLKFKEGDKIILTADAKYISDSLKKGLIGEVIIANNGYGLMYVRFNLPNVFTPVDYWMIPFIDIELYKQEQLEFNFEIQSW